MTNSPDSSPRKQTARSRAPKSSGDADLREAFAAMGDADRAIAERIHAIVMSAAPELVPRMWYGMPAYAKDGKVVCFFQPAGKFKTRYATFGFQEAARLDDGRVWPVAFAVTELTSTEEERIAALVRRAVHGSERP